MTSSCEGARVVGAVVIQSPGDFLFFEDARTAESYMEPVDVKAGEYRAFARDGRALCIEILEQEAKGFFGLAKRKAERLELREGPGAAISVAELRSFLAQVGAPVHQSAGLEDLMSVGFERYRYPG